MKVQSRRERIEDAGATVLFVAFDDVELLRGSLLRGIEPSFPVLVDRERHTYRGWGLRRSSVAGVWLDPRVWCRFDGSDELGHRRSVVTTLRARPGYSTVAIDDEVAPELQGVRPEEAEALTAPRQHRVAPPDARIEPDAGYG